MNTSINMIISMLTSGLVLWITGVQDDSNKEVSCGVIITLVGLIMNMLMIFGVIK